MHLKIFLSVTFITTYFIPVYLAMKFDIDANSAVYRAIENSHFISKICLIALIIEPFRNQLLLIATLRYVFG